MKNVSPAEPGLAPLQYASRAPKLRDALTEVGERTLFVTSLTNIRWLTGFTGSSAWLLVTPDDMTLITDGRYAEQAREQLAAAGVPATIRVGATRVAQVAHLEQAVGAADSISFEAAHVSVADHLALSGALECRWLATNGTIEELRRAKDLGEIDRMTHAAHIADLALANTAQFLHKEPTEVEFRDALEAAMRAAGGHGVSFDTIIAAGANAALPHHQPDRSRIVEGMTVVVDFGALYDGYHSDMTRTYILGDPTPMQAEVYQVVLDAQCAGVAAVRPEARGRALDAVCRERIASAGWGDWFSHGTGHGVGLQIHEAPWLTQSFDDTLRVHDVVTVEPGVYRRDFGGVRIEDMVVVTTDGCQSLTKTPKDSPCLPLPPTN